MDTLSIIGAVFVVLGIIGSIVPALPGPIFGYIGLVLLFFAKGQEVVSSGSLIAFGVVMAALLAIDYLAPILGAKFFGASRMGLLGAIAGAVVGIFFFPPLGIFLGAFIGAIIGEMHGGKNFKGSLKAGFGVILGSVSVIILQTIFSLVLAYYFFSKLF
ncbi:MAG TPA: DUF456 domain-containing protein [Candidatus Moranbacteria bacterium]|nr:DUF456 domain-containing protein [Candidatus Moranbacteria bacterium]